MRGEGRGEERGGRREGGKEHTGQYRVLRSIVLVEIGNAESVSFGPWLALEFVRPWPLLFVACDLLTSE